MPGMPTWARIGIIESVRVGGTVRIPVGELDRLALTHPTNEENRR